MATEPFIIEGDLWLKGNDGGQHMGEWALYQDSGGFLPPYRDVGQMIAHYFHIAQQPYVRPKNRGPDYDSEEQHPLEWHIGPVRITIERLEE